MASKQVEVVRTAGLFEDSYAVVVGGKKVIHVLAPYELSIVKKLLRALGVTWTASTAKQKKEKKASDDLPF